MNVQQVSTESDVRHFCGSAFRTAKMASPERLAAIRLGPPVRRGEYSDDWPGTVAAFFKLYKKVLSILAMLSPSKGHFGSFLKIFLEILKIFGTIRISGLLGNFIGSV